MGNRRSNPGKTARNRVKRQRFTSRVQSAVAHLKRIRKHIRASRGAAVSRDFSLAKVLNRLDGLGVPAQSVKTREREVLLSFIVA